MAQAVKVMLLLPTLLFRPEILRKSIIYFLFSK